MAPPLSSLYTLSLALALIATLLVAATLRLLAILPNSRSKPTPWRPRPIATRILIVLGSGGHTHEMFDLLRDLNTRKYTHRTYVVSSGDTFSAQRAVAFEKALEAREQARKKEGKPTGGVTVKQRVRIKVTDAHGRTRSGSNEAASSGYEDIACVGPAHYDVAVVPRARKIYQPLYTAPFSCLWTLISCFPILLGAPSLPWNPKQNDGAYEAAAADLPDLIVTNGPATAVIVILASLLLRLFDFRGANTRGKAKTIYVESFARVKTLSLSGKLLLRIVDRFLVQWEELDRAGGKAEYQGILV